MCGGELGVLGVVWVRVGDEVFEKKEVARGALYDCEEPVTQLELAAAGILFLRGEEGSEGRVILRGTGIWSCN